MHSPEVVVFDVRLPVRRTHWKRPLLLTVWHNEPGGADSGRVCKGMGSTELTLHNIVWAAKHLRHLEVHVEPYRRVRRWLTTRCAHCGFRFLWKQPRFGYMGSDDTYHEFCQAYSNVRRQLDELTSYVTAPEDLSSNARWRVEYQLQRAAAAQENSAEENR